MKIYLLSVLLLFFTIIPVSAQPIPFHSSKIPASKVSLKKDITLNLTLKVLIQGLFDGSVMLPDTVTVELRDPNSTCTVVESQIGVLNSEGVGTFTYTKAVNDYPYFIVVKHRNALETWSATAQTFTSSELSYDFTTGIGQAYTDNGGVPQMVQIGTKWCIYGGDINKDGAIDAFDLSPTDNDNMSGGTPGIPSGLPTDITGDGGVDAFDLSIIDNNNFRGVYSTSPIQDIPGEVCYQSQIYHIVLIGTQYWLKENMNVGTMILVDSTQTNNGTVEKYCLGNDTANCSTYGGYYQWDEAMQFATNDGAKGICPVGWHIPTIDEFNILIAAVESDGNALKEIGQGGGGIGTNTSGFSALISGYRLPSGFFWETDISSTFWSSTVSDAVSSYQMYLFSYNNSITVGNFTKDFGYGVRCIKN